MPLAPGSMVGPYKILARLGAGGMGVVFRAQDTVLGREVALKVLPDVLANDPDRRSRFEREARVLASLNHPNIATLHGLKRLGDRTVLEMELVPGETLAERLADERMPLDEALPIFKQIAQGLEAAHERGIIHRDLKPANVKIMPDGRVKVLDFGLAKALDEDPVSAEITHSPTATSSRSRPGVVLGTVGYMSPEQARGRPVDRRTDVWAFGCVFYETLSGRTPFKAETTSDTLAAILKEEPDWDALAGVPLSLLRLIRRCLQKDPQARLRDIADARLEIEEVLQDSAVRAPFTEAPPTPVPDARRRALGRWIGASAGAVALVVAAALATAGVIRFLRADPSLPVRVAVPLQAQQQLAPGPSPAFAVSPDGRHLVYAALQPGARTQLYLRPLDRFEAVPMRGTEGGTAPFFSPDGRWIGFYAADALQKVALDGGAPFKICDAPPVLSATWGADDTILFATTLAGEGLWRVPAAGGTPEEWTTPDPDRGEVRHAFPQMLPGGRAALFTIVTDEAWYPAVLSLASREWQTVTQVRMNGAAARFVSSGHLIFAQPGGLVAVAFDATRAVPRGSLVPILERVDMTSDRALPFAASLTGSLVYLPGGATPPRRTLVVVDREGRATPLTDAQAPYTHPRFSPDGRWLAVAIEAEGGSDVWVHDLRRGTRTRLTSGGGGVPVWMPDAGHLSYHAPRATPWNLFARPADGSGPAQPLLTGQRPERPDAWAQNVARLLPGTLPVLTGANPQFPMSWSADGRTLAFTERKPNGERDIWVLERDGESAVPFLMTPFDESSPVFAPDGRFLAYVSDESGQSEVYVQPYPGPGGKWLISIDGGTDPVWSADGRELFYRHGDVVMVVPIETTRAFSAGTPRPLFEARYETSGLARNYDISPDGRRFVMVRRDEAPELPQLHLVIGWAGELQLRAPSNR